jgi:hypothetical protein
LELDLLIASYRVFCVSYAPLRGFSDKMFYHTDHKNIRPSNPIL